MPKQTPPTLLLILLACGGEKATESAPRAEAQTDAPVEVDTAAPADEESGAPAAEFVEPGAGCTLDEQGDIGHDGVVDWTNSITYNSIALGSDRQILSQSYVHINGDSLSRTGNFDSLGNSLLEEKVSNIGGVADGYRYIYERDDDGNLTAYQYFDLVDGAWELYQEATRTPIDGDFSQGYDEASTYNGALYQTRVEHGRSGGRLDETVVYKVNGDTTSLLYTLTYDYGDDELVDLITLNLDQSGTGDSADSLIYTWEFGYNADGVRTSALVTDYQGRDPVVITHILADDKGRETYRLEFAPVFEEEVTASHTWESALDRRSLSAFTHSTDPTGNYTDTFSYEGEWPWSETAVRVYDDATLDLDAVVQRAWSCP